MKNKFTPGIFIILLVLTFNLKAQPPKFVVPEEIGLYEKLDSILPDDVYLVNQDSNIVNLKSLINKPTFIKFIVVCCKIV